MRLSLRAALGAMVASVVLAMSPAAANAASVNPGPHRSHTFHLALSKTYADATIVTHNGDTTSTTTVHVGKDPTFQFPFPSCAPVTDTTAQNPFTVDTVSMPLVTQVTLAKADGHTSATISFTDVGTYKALAADGSATISGAYKDHYEITVVDPVFASDNLTVLSGSKYTYTRDLRLTIGGHIVMGRIVGGHTFFTLHEDLTAGAYNGQSPNGTFTCANGDTTSE